MLVISRPSKQNGFTQHYTSYLVVSELNASVSTQKNNFTHHYTSLNELFLNFTSVIVRK